VPWIRNQPSGRIHASGPARRTDAAATRKTMYIGTYKYGIQSVLSMAVHAAKTTTTAKQAPRPQRPGPAVADPATSAINVAFSA